LSGHGYLAIVHAVAGVLDAAGVVATSTWRLREPRNGGRSDQRDGVRGKVVDTEAFG
jgi:hypothetical protein